MLLFLIGMSVGTCLGAVAIGVLVSSAESKQGESRAAAKAWRNARHGMLPRC